MLRRSGNVAFRWFARQVGAERLNKYYESRNWLKTKVAQETDGERVFIGNTSPSDMLLQLESILDGDGDLRSFANYCLKNNEISNYGSRSLETAPAVKTVYNKAGDYDCSSTEGDGDRNRYRNEVMRVEFVKGTYLDIAICVSETPPEDTDLDNEQYKGRFAEKYLAEAAKIIFAVNSYNLTTE